MTNAPVVRESQEHKLLSLLLLLCALLIAQPFLPATVLGLTVLDILFSIVMLNIVTIFYKRKSRIITILILAIPLLSLRWFLHLSESPVSQLIANLFGFALFLYVAAILIIKIMEENRVTFDTIYGSISVYLIIGIAWAFLFACIEYFYPNSFAIQDGVRVQFKFEDFRTIIYYSLTTLTTLGYGDIYPLSAPARILSSLEAIVGQIYLMVLVARLVGLHIVHSQRKHKS